MELKSTALTTRPSWHASQSLQNCSYSQTFTTPTAFHSRPTYIYQTTVYDIHGFRELTHALASIKHSRIHLNCRLLLPAKLVSKLTETLSLLCQPQDLLNEQIFEMIKNASTNQLLASHVNLMNSPYQSLHATPSSSLFINAKSVHANESVVDTR